ncbi:Secretion protein HlyD [Robiginitalea biformata HTCC2501]|uniref:Secretion protein HlyD n=1 Tax=Robiginitalea biformata (strain ATCC BAA-864 / DSM 15991 / KCTC 12146 / HTCC2501) TaxID=313596 RepID=A4CP13_ROBBH|nr:Secretion protein HlyD [Robiginitalea biformata HTCC2501]
MILLSAGCRSSEDQGHSHDEAGEHSHEGEGTPAMAFTVWTEKTELFVEFPALVVGQTSRFAAHFTVLQGHRPVREGSVTVSLIRGNKGIRHTVDGPNSPGIFTPALQPGEAGSFQLVFDINTPDYSDRITLEDIPVFASLAEAAGSLPKPEEGNDISFLKEQAWKMDFQTRPATEKEIYETLPTSGTWQVAPSDYRTLVAPANGRVNFSRSSLTEGSPVSKGQVLMTLSSSGFARENLETEIQKARAELNRMESEYERKKALLNSRIVPRAEFEAVEQNYLVAKANYETLSQGYTGNGIQVAAPFDGYIKSIASVNGDYVAQGATLLTITSHKSSMLQVQVSPRYARELQSIRNIWYQPAPGTWSSLLAKGGKILSVGKEVEADQPLIRIYAEVNEGVEMPEGSFTEVQVAFGNPGLSTVVPAQALLEDYGEYSVIVQRSGEAFERRYVQIGKRNGNEVEITQGLAPGEVVVTKGAYQVKMASMSGQAPAHGHAH